MVFFYEDESGSNRTGDYVLSGYLAHRSTWDLFIESWNKFRCGALPIDYLKMSEWEHRDSARHHTGQFVSMNAWEANLRVC